MKLNARRKLRSSSHGRRFVAVAVCWASAVGAQERSAPNLGDRRPLAITRVTVVDVERGRGLHDQTVVVRAGRIAAVGDRSRVRIPVGARVVDGRGRFLIPGLWDMHVHNTGPGSGSMLPVYVAYGITAVRDMGADIEVLRRHRDRIARGDEIGPRILMAGPILDGPIGIAMPPAHRRFRVEVTDPARARFLVDSIARLGADFIKVHERLAPAVHAAIAAQAMRRGLRIAGHVPTALGALGAIEAGQQTIEHLVNVPFVCTVAERDELRPRNGLEALFGRCSDDDPVALMRRFVERGTWHTPTLVVQQRVALGPNATSGDPGMRHVPGAVRAILREVGPLDLPAPRGDARARFARLLAKRVEQVGQMYRAGVPLLVGTDAPGVAPGWSVHEEMRLFTRAGIPAADALRAATLSPARVFDATDSLGTIAAGKIADMVLLDADPLDDIRNTLRIRAVIANGRLLERATLDGILTRTVK